MCLDIWRGFPFLLMAFPADLHEFEPVLRLKLSRQHESRIIAADKSGKLLEVMTIKVGISKNRSPEGLPFFYSKEMLERLMPKFEGLPAYVFENPDGSKGHVRDESDDAKRATGFVKNKVGVYKNPRWGKDADGNEGVICDLHLVDDELAKRIKNAWESGFKDFAELSIDGDGMYAEDSVDGIKVANGLIETLHSCDIVDSAAAGGKILRIAAATNHKGQKTMKANAKRLMLRILESKKSAKSEARITRFLEAEGEKVATVAAEVLQEQAEEMAGDSQYVTLAKEALAALEAGNADGATAALKKLLDYETQQAAKKETDKNKPAQDPAKASDKPADSAPIDNGVKPEDVNALKEEVESMKRDLADEKAFAEIEKSNLPAPVKEKLKESVKGRGLELTRIKESISIEAATLDKLGFGNVGGTIRGTNDVGLNDAVLALDGFWADQDMKDSKNRVVPRFTSIKEAAHKGWRIDRDRVEDPGLFLGLLSGNQYDSQIRRKFKESFTAVTFDQAFGDSVHRALLREYQLPDYRDYEKITESVEVNDFRDHNYIRLGYWGEAPTVDPDGGTYNPLPTLTDEQVALNLETRGGIFSITRKMIVNDDMRIIRLLPIRAARMLKLRPYRAVFDLLINNTVTSYDSVALLHAASHFNLTSGALSPTTLKDVRSKMYNQKAYGSDATNPEFLMESNWPKWLVIHPDYEDMALALCKAQSTVQVAAASGEWAAGQLLPNGGAPNVHAQYGMDYILCPRISNTAHWWAIADPRKVPGIAVATLRGQKEPEVSQEAQGSGSNFTAKKVSYCVSWDVGVKVVEHRAIAGYTS